MILLLVIGSVVYNEILVIPWWGFRKSISEKHIYIKERTEMNKRVKEGSQNDNHSVQFMNSVISKQNAIGGDIDLK